MNIQASEHIFIWGGEEFKARHFFLIHQMFLKIINFLCIYFWLCWVFIVVWCRGFSLPWLFLLKNTGSRQAGFSGGRARLRCSMALESSCTRDWTCVPCIERWIPNYWMTREVLKLDFEKKKNWLECFICRSVHISPNY